MTKRGWWQSCEELGLPGYGTGDGGSEVNNLYNSDESLFDKFFSQMAKQTLVQDQQVGGGVAMAGRRTRSATIPERCIKCFTCEIACKQWREIRARHLQAAPGLRGDRGDLPRRHPDLPLDLLPALPRCAVHPGLPAGRALPEARTAW